MKNNKMKTRVEVIGGEEYEFACADCDKCLGMKRNPDGTMNIASTNGDKIQNASDDEIKRFIEMYQSKTV